MKKATYQYLRLKNTTIRTRVLIVFSILVFALILLFTAVHAYFERVNLDKEYMQLSRQTAHALSFMPALANGLQENDISEVQGIVDRVRLQANNPFVYVLTENGEDLLTGTKRNEQNLQPTLIFGSYITERYGSGKNEVIQSTAPIYDQVGEAEQLIGAVRVTYPLNMLEVELFARLRRNAIAGLAGIVLSLFSAWLIASSIQRDTFGHEPALVASLYKEREALLQSLNEGLCAVNQLGEVTLLNPAAKRLLQNQQVSKGVLRELGTIQAVENGLTLTDEVRLIGEKTLIVNTRPIDEGGQRAGAISSFRDFTEMKQVKETMAQLQVQSDGLRAQTHEFRNKLYVLMGLLQLNKQEDALDFIVNETNVQREQTTPLFKKIADVGVQALLLAKMAKAAERHVHLTIEDSSQLQPIDRIPTSDLSIIIGNILDNAMEAVADSEKKEVLFFASDAGDEWVFDVYDSGNGFKKGVGNLLEEGLSTKGKGRGFGLSNVHRALMKWNGLINIDHLPEEDGTMVSIYIPKERRAKS
ncbi:GHKL domain-containing protein [Alkalihalobacillus sp. LMS6]|uniref:sensor histidine kinase n=1 Tax=Alkalihalobacillus sp. LMS6 TaxID=2924034 RepID=UPI0020CFF395|nr:ATP-binding protein [Alkalihalobacillus sp. LMS6]UTR06218.1 GHKL domain-containing protein [Alkalihalobacillus sp. LMS6]